MSTIETRLRPASLDELVGQPRLKERIGLAINATIARKTRFPHTFLHGVPGSGKSTLAHLIAEALGDPILTIAKPCAANELVTRLHNFGAGIVLIDEIHAWPNGSQDSLLPLLEAQCLERGSVTLSFPYLTVVAATTERAKVRKALRSRFAIKPPMESYTDGDLVDITALMAQKAHLDLSEDLIAGIGRAAGGVPRNARTLIMCAEELDANNETIDLGRILDLTDTQADGLTGEHVAYLRAVDANGGRAGAKVISTRLRLDEPAVRDLEELLLDRGYVLMDPTAGRILTKNGRDRCGGAPRLARVS